MANKKQTPNKKKSGNIKYYLTPLEFNNICSVLEIIGNEIKANKYNEFAKYMLSKLLRYTVVFGDINTDDCRIRVCLYDNESELLLQIYTTFVCEYLAASDRKPKDFMSALRKQKQYKSE